MLGKHNHKTQNESRVCAVDENIILNNADNSIQVIESQVDVHTIERNIADKVRSEVDSVMTKVETRVHDAVLTAMESLVIPRID